MKDLHLLTMGAIFYCPRLQHRVILEKSTLAPDGEFLERATLVKREETLVVDSLLDNNIQVIRGGFRSAFGLC